MKLKPYLQLAFALFSLTTTQIVSADYMVGQYYCYEYPYHHCVYYSHPTDASELRHQWLPFFTPDQPIPRAHGGNAYRHMEPAGYEW